MLRIVLPCAFVIAVMSSASADHCSTWSTWSEGVVEAETPAGTSYVFFHGLDEQPRWPWIYWESNGLPDLQRLDQLHDDTCHGMIAPDTLIF